MIEVKIEINEPYKVYFYQMKYTLIIFLLFLVLFELMAFITDFTSPYGAKSWMYIVTFLFSCFVTTIQAFPVSIYHSLCIWLDKKQSIEISGSFKIVKAYSNHEPDSFNYNPLYANTYKINTQRMHIEFLSDDNKKITLYSDSKVTDIFRDLASPNGTYINKKNWTYEESLKPLVFTNLVYGKYSKILLECEYEVDEKIYSSYEYDDYDNRSILTSTSNQTQIRV